MDSCQVISHTCYNVRLCDFYCVSHRAGLVLIGLQIGDDLRQDSIVLNMLRVCDIFTPVIFSIYSPTNVVTNYSTIFTEHRRNVLCKLSASYHISPSTNTYLHSPHSVTTGTQTCILACTCIHTRTYSHTLTHRLHPTFRRWTSYGCPRSSIYSSPLTTVPPRGTRAE